MANTWYCVLMDDEDNDWGTGSYIYEEALAMARRNRAKYVGHIAEGNDPICEELELVEPGCTIEEMRIRKGYSRAELARQLTAPIRTLEDWAAGKAQPPLWIEKMIIREIDKM